MRIRKDKKLEGEQLPLEEGKKALRQAQDKKKKGDRDEGPRWVSVALLVITMGLAIVFWLQGSGGVSFPVYQSGEDYVLEE